MSLRPFALCSIINAIIENEDRTAYRKKRSVVGVWQNSVERPQPQKSFHVRKYKTMSDQRQGQVSLQYVKKTEKGGGLQFPHSCTTRCLLSQAGEVSRDYQLVASFSPLYLQYLHSCANANLPLVMRERKEHWPQHLSC